MSLRPQFIDDEIPEQTAEIARASFPKGNRYMKMRDEMGSIYDDELFADLYPQRGQPAAAPWQLALVTVMQFAENLTDRQAADAVRGRIDWKYALGLEITDAGFNFSVLSEFRDRLLAGGAEGRLLERMLKLFKEKGLLNKDEQRTDATHILAAVRNLNRLEIVGETLRCALNVLAQVDREWLCEQIDAEWFARYSQPVTDFRLPKPKKEREVLALVFGRDGDQLLNEILLGSAPAYLRQLPAVEGLRQVWVQHYYHDGTALQWRTQNNFPPSGVMIASPYDTESRYSHKRGMEWRGYKVGFFTYPPTNPNLKIATQEAVQQAVEPTHQGQGQGRIDRTQSGHES